MDANKDTKKRIHTYVCNCSVRICLLKISQLSVNINKQRSNNYEVIIIENTYISSFSIRFKWMFVFKPIYLIIFHALTTHLRCLEGYVEKIYARGRRLPCRAYLSYRVLAK